MSQAQQLIQASQEGRDEKQSIESGGLVGHHPQIYRYLSWQVPRIAEAVCPEDFAKSVAEFCEGLDVLE